MLPLLLIPLGSASAGSLASRTSSGFHRCPVEICKRPKMPLVIFTQLTWPRWRKAWLQIHDWAKLRARLWPRVERRVLVSSQWGAMCLHNNGSNHGYRSPNHPHERWVIISYVTIIVSSQLGSSRRQTPGAVGAGSALDSTRWVQKLIVINHLFFFSLFSHFILIKRHDLLSRIPVCASPTHHEILTSTCWPRSIIR